MDPTATLNRIKQLIKNIKDDALIYERFEQREGRSEPTELADLVQNLDEWIMRGGFLPEQWRIKKR